MQPHIQQNNAIPIHNTVHIAKKNYLRTVLGRIGLMRGLFASKFRPAQPLETTSQTISTSPQTGRQTINVITKKPEPSLQELAEEPAIVLYEASTVFPFDPFPNTITIDTEQIRILRRDFFFIKSTNSINHEDLFNVTANCGPILGSLIIETKFYNSDPIRVDKLSRKDAEVLRKLLHGLIVSKNHKVDLNERDPAALREKLTVIGEVGSSLNHNTTAQPDRPQAGQQQHALRQPPRP